MKKYSLSALVAAGLLAGGLSVSSAQAADLGGNCCADLEERIAELEATTARKGNRKVSLTISGWVAEQVMWFDDGEESNVYVSGIGRTLQSNVKFTGEANITPGWSAGYVIHIELGGPDTFGLSADDDDPADNINNPFVGIRDTDRGVYALQSYWFVKSQQLGKVSVGRISQPSDNTAILVDGSGSLVPANWVLFDGLSFALNGGQTGGVWGHLAWCATINDGIGGDCNGITENVVRYDSPTFAGFSFSASWGEDDMWDVAARYAGEWNGFKVAAAVAYTDMSDENTAINDSTGALGFGFVVEEKDVQYFQAGLYVEHVPSGLFLYGAYGKERNDSVYDDCDPSGFPTCTQNNDPYSVDNENRTWYVKGGVRQRWSSLGHTVLYGEYGEHDDAIFPGFATKHYELGGTDEGVTDSKLKRYGLGIVQEIDAAAMSIWLAWRHHEGELTCGSAPEESYCNPEGAANFSNEQVDFDDVDIIKFGALINF